jgi:AcrR family transcriptional regulator
MSENAAKYDVPRRGSARERLLQAAGELFYEEGLNTVGIDKVIERAGVAKASLYNIFGSKEELIRSYLMAKHASRRARVLAFLERFPTPRERLLGIFELQAEMAAEPDYRGCAFVRANAELRPGSPAREVCNETRAWLRALLEQLAQQAGVSRAAELAERFVLLYDGAGVATQMDGDRGAPRRAQALAASLLDAELTLQI